MLRGITFSGGEPFCQPKPLLALAKQVHALHKDVTAYSGWTYEQLVSMHNPDVDALLNACDVLVDGPYIEQQRNLELLFRGSENQRVILVQESLKADGIVQWDDGEGLSI